MFLTLHAAYTLRSNLSTLKNQLIDIEMPHGMYIYIKMHIVIFNLITANTHKNKKHKYRGSKIYKLLPSRNYRI